MPRLTRRRTPRFTSWSTVAMLAILAGCGGTTAGSDPASTEPAPPTSMAPEPMTSAAPQTSQPASAAPASQPAAPSEAGSFTVDDTAFAVTLLNRCIPFTDEPGNIDLQALAQGAQLNLNLSNDWADVSVQGAAVQELAGSMSFGLAGEVDESSVSGDRWTGSATLTDSMGTDASVDVTWDVQIPSDIRDCSL